MRSSIGTPGSGTPPAAAVAGPRRAVRRLVPILRREATAGVSAALLHLEDAWCAAEVCLVRDEYAEYAMSKYHLQPGLNGWLIQAPAPAHRHADQRRAAPRARLRGDGRDQDQRAESRRE